MSRRDITMVTLTGHVEAEPEMRFTADGEPNTTLFLISAQPTSRDQHATERFRLVAWGDPLAEQCNDLLPGTHLLAEGQLQSSTSDDREERARLPYEVVVRELVIINSLTRIPSKTDRVAPAIRPASAPASVAPIIQPPSPRTPALVSPSRIPRGPQRPS